MNIEAPSITPTLSVTRVTSVGAGWPAIQRLHAGDVSIRAGDVSIRRQAGSHSARRAECCPPGYGDCGIGEKGVEPSPFSLRGKVRG